MCTVTYIPQNNGDYIFTSNRDEAPHRSPENLEQVHLNGINLAFPRDRGAGGTWIATAGDNRMACILNGAFVKHKHKPPYRRSRGLMLLDSFYFSNVSDFCRKYVVQGMEPFTFLVIEKEALWEVRWDEKELTQRKLDFTRPYIWASAPLYDTRAQEKRRQWFQEFLNQGKSLQPKTIVDFHRFTGDGDSWNDLVMNRNNQVRTVSITQIRRQANKQFSLNYIDLLRDREVGVKVPIKHP